MKKKLEADLLSIAHRILQMKNKSDQDQVFAEVQKLYEKLTVMRFVEEHFSEVKPTAGSADIEAEMEKAFEEAEAHDGTHAKADNAENSKSEAEDQVKEDKTENKGEGDQEDGKDVSETAGKTSAQVNTEDNEPSEAAVAEEAKPSGENKPEIAAKDTEDKSEENKESAVEESEISEPEAPTAVEKEENEQQETTEAKPEAKEEPVKEPAAEDKAEERKPKQISFDELMQHHYEEPVFERADTSKKEVPAPETVPQPESVEEAAVALGGEEDIKAVETPKPVQPQEEKRPSSLHEQIGKSITIGLNDRIGFEKNLFGGSAEDMNRVLSQLNTFNSLQEARDFIEDMVKPDYNNWTGKEDYEQRFLDIVERKFS